MTDMEKIFREQNAESDSYTAEESTEKKEIVSEVVNELGIVASGTKVTGNITTKGHLAVSGTVVGDISAKGNVIVTGNVRGKISCSSLMLEDCSLNTEITASECVIVKEGVKITGKIFCKDITVMGSIAGDITASGKVGLSKEATVRGNITAAAIGVAVGAKLEGNLSIR